MLPASILANYDVLDLVDIDVQGEEVRVISSVLAMINEKVKRLHIGTHSPSIEEQLIEILSIQGWKCVRSYRTGQVNETPYGHITFQDGIQTWVNQRFAGQHE